MVDRINWLADVDPRRFDYQDECLFPLVSNIKLVLFHFVLVRTRRVISKKEISVASGTCHSVYFLELDAANVFMDK